MTVSFPYAASDDARLHAPATARNREPILEQLRRFLPESGRVLELGCGTGEHAAFFAGHFPGLLWLPTDAEPRGLESTRAHLAAAGVHNVEPPRLLDLMHEPGALPPFDALFCANVIHIAPPEVTERLLLLATRLTSGGRCILYGPFARGGRLEPESNVEFDAWLKARDPRFGVRDAQLVEARAAELGLEPEAFVPMPANNHVLVLRKP